jgi:hypothetical protein
MAVITRVELASIVPLETLVDKSDLPFAQLARLSVPKSARARDATYALFKSAWKWTAQQQIRSLVIATPAWSRPMYKDLLFRDLGPAGVFLLWYGASVEHRSMLLNDLEQTWRKAGHPLSPLWFNSHHPQLDISGEP